MAEQTRRYPVVQVYTRDGDQELWEEAREVAGPRGLSELVAEAVREYMAKRREGRPKPEQ